MKTTDAAKIIDRLNDITIGFTTTVCGVVVTRWTSGFELETWGRATVLLSAEQAAAKLTTL